ncbi:hypothetical protein AGMMS49928_27310 [Spirochaetia bacterium]|nr:hypothetical protein AGMMS49928_27310 [Spirochaetia bacterium]
MHFAFYNALTRRITARLVFIIGLFLMFFGSAFLLGSLAGISRVSVLTSFFFVIIGCLCAVFAIKLNKRSLYLFFAAFFLQVGLFLFLAALGIITVVISQAWPLISVFSGLALIPAGWRRYGALRNRYLVPGIAFVVLGCMLMVFSFRMVPFSFSHFMLSWWPLLVVLAGLMLVLLALGGKKDSGAEKP